MMKLQWRAGSLYGSMGSGGAEPEYISRRSSLELSLKHQLQGSSPPCCKLTSWAPITLQGCGSEQYACSSTTLLPINKGCDGNAAQTPVSSELRGAGREPGFYVRLLEGEGYNVHGTMSARNPCPEPLRQEYTDIRFRVNRLTALTLDWHATALSLHNSLPLH